MYVVSTVFIILCVVITIYGISQKKTSQKWSVVMSIALILAIGTAGFMARKFTAEETQKQIAYAKTNNYTFYLDGQEIDPDTVFIENYRILLIEDRAILTER